MIVNILLDLLVITILLYDVAFVRRRFEVQLKNQNDASYLKPKSGVTEIHLMTLFIAVFGTVVGRSHSSLLLHISIEMQCNVMLPFD